MTQILDLLHACEKRTFAAGDTILAEGASSGHLLFLISGAVEVVKGDVQVVKIATPGAAFGELSVLLGGPHTATVRALTPSTFYQVEDPRAFLESSPLVTLHVCELLARRLDAMTKYLVDVKHQLDGHDHIGLVDNVLSTLLHRQPTKRIRPVDSTVRPDEATQ